MAVISDGAESPGDLMRRVAQLEREVADLRSARRLENARIGDGGLTISGRGRARVVDEFGREIVVMGVDPNPDGSTKRRGMWVPRVQGGADLVTIDDGFGITIFAVRAPDGAATLQIGDDGQVYVRDTTVGSPTSNTLVALSTLAFGLRANANIVQGTTTVENAWVDLTFAGDPDPGPSVDVTIGESGRAIVFSSAVIDVQNSTSAWMGFEVTGASSRAPAILGSAFARGPNEASRNIGVSSTGIDLVTGLNQGDHTFTAKYRVSNLDVVAFSNRVLLVIPF